ncbi:hypothetical protein BU24DRAFT_487883 [Aaosphaeria arxii CBS 175.79]|uniref:Altered inheritance of mitochondria protein 6 n=1 Tax=Aaosphaeria arxii CBS 175.79 TaxID=1450172 RepID=A0A6A5Y9I5_9PLEO|nr:uncharacterized protein BU24DRAFT_487883 [Aaosphaeria arxii CBS 175.79]KAF2021470.1 hypothetical protein BU24DRAFT_487883 [Aaosphaeria arxii CBS 175.79]
MARSSSDLELMPFDDTESLEGSSPKGRKKSWIPKRRARAIRRHRKVEEDVLPSSWRQRLCSRRATRYAIRSFWILAACILTSLLTLSITNPARLSSFDMAFSAFVHPDGVPLDVDSVHYPETFLRSVMPIPCQSHNDEQRHTPLHAALGTGCVSIEADIWASDDPDSNDIFVGHTTGDLDPNKSLKRMYIDPLVRLLEIRNGPHAKQPQANGVFSLAPSTSLTLVLDFKSTSAELWEALEVNLDPLASRDWLTFWDASAQARVQRPITIAVTGTDDFDTILRGKLKTTATSSPTVKGLNDTFDPLSIDRYIFFDAPLHDLIQPGDPDSSEAPFTPSDPSNPDRSLSYKYNPSNSHLASTSLYKAIGPISPSLLTSASDPDHFQRRILRQQIRAARDRGLVSRYWGLPRWPRGLRDGVWEVLEREGVGLLNVDDLRGVRKGEWGGGLWGRWWGKEKHKNWGWPGVEEKRR